MRSILFAIIYLSVSANTFAQDPNTDVIKVEASIDVVRIQLKKNKQIWPTQSYTDPLTGDRIEVVKAKDVSAAYREARDQIFSSLETAPPLKEYVEKEFPSAPPSGLGGSPFVRASDANDVAGRIERLLIKLRSKSLAINLEIISKPVQGATFVMISDGGYKIPPAPTNDVLKGVWRGRYTYTLTKGGYKTITGRIDLIDDSGNHLTCGLIPNDSSVSVSPCKFE